MDTHLKSPKEFPLNGNEIPLAPWEIIVDDFLDTGCFLRSEERSFLLQELRAEKAYSESVDVYPSFSLGMKLINIIHAPLIRECWLYYPKRKRIEKHHLKKAA